MHQPPSLDYKKPLDINLSVPRKVSVVIVGAGLVGLTLALDLARRGVPSVVLETRQALIEGSRAIVFAQRSLEILQRLGLGERLTEKGVNWNLSRIYHRERESFSFDFKTEPYFGCPAFLNIQQTYIEQWLIEDCLASGWVDLRCLNTVTSLESSSVGASVMVTSPDGSYRLDCDWLIACDGARSFVRNALNLPLVGRHFHDHFLIVDVEMKPDFPAERRFWFDPPFHPGHSVLLHKQPDNLWRVDFQLGAEADPAFEKQPARVTERLKAMLDPKIAFRIDWISIYTFRCRRLENFVHSRVVFAGDSAHEVSPFGGRGGNGGIQDADNLAWKLCAVVKHGASPKLLQSYDEERVYAADENIINSTRSAQFITPPNHAIATLRQASLVLSETTAMGRTFVNSGRLSSPARLGGIGQFLPDTSVKGRVKPGDVALDAPVKNGDESSWLLHFIGRKGFTLLCYRLSSNYDGGVNHIHIEDISSSYPLEIITVVSATVEQPTVASIDITLVDHYGLVAKRYDLACGSIVLFRPDQHVLDVFPSFNRDDIERTLAHSMPIATHAERKI
ncbi:FAD-dependent monooxygenase [Photorhabdus heterorhabditis]|uniref:FAD-dependent monooxygenase n=1 Tax=Photorhabdus heterorhabditis TaxID=880156 RepID=UPI00156274A6|nr:FAD-dependent monooxygenase [Photorhabdus heterorhabditis]NRN26835.1 oxygenase [Photorhabdus heterorhabditis subsp. aluminescens]